MWNELLPALRINIFVTIVFGLIYPLGMTGLCQLFFPHRANGSLVMAGGKMVGSELIGQNFSKPEYFHPRPSQAGSGYDATASGGSNLGPTSAKLVLGAIEADNNNRRTVDFDGVSLRVVHYCRENDVPYESSEPLHRFEGPGGNLDDVKLIEAFNDPKAPLVFRAKRPIPADAVTGSGSGLDPDISPANAEIQTARVARTRRITVDQARNLVAQFTQSRTFGVLGEPRVNVLALNLALDRRFPVRK